MERRAAAAHRVHGRCPVLSRPGLLADGALARRSRVAADIGHRSAADSRDGGAAGVPRGERPTARRERFLEELMPKLSAWHEYLYRERARTDGGLVEIWHPWESGMDNSPLWDGALERLAFDAERLPRYERVDVQVAEATERPSDGEYDRYVYLVTLFRELGYDASRIRDVVPFALQPVLFNSLLVQSNRDLAEIARIVGADPDRFESWAESTARALDEQLWDDEHAVYIDFDVKAGRRVGTRTAAGLAPLYAGVPSPARAERMVELLAGSRVDVGDAGWAVTSLRPADPGFQAARYWRGPVWPILNWVLQRGLDRYGYSTRAAEVRGALVELARSGRLLRALQPRDRPRAGRRAVRVDGGPPPRRAARERGRAPGRCVRDESLTSVAFFVTSAWQLAGRER